MDVGQDRPRTDLNGGPSLVESFLIFGDWDTLSILGFLEACLKGLYCTARFAGFTCLPLNLVTPFTRTDGCSGLFPYTPTKQSSVCNSMSR